MEAAQRASLATRAAWLPRRRTIAGALLAALLALPFASGYHTMEQHRGSLIQDWLGSAMAMTSRGEPRQVGDVTLYEHCTGTCSFLRLISPKSVTLGHHIFTVGRLDAPHLRHELTHVRQAEQEGFLWFPAYLWGSLRQAPRCGFDLTCYYKDNPYEVQAFAAQDTPVVHAFGRAHLGPDAALRPQPPLVFPD